MGAFAFLLIQSLCSNSVKTAHSQARYNLTLIIHFDNYPAEINWNIVDTNNFIVLSGNGYNSSQYDSITQSVMINDNCHKLIIYDSFGDGFYQKKGDWGWFTMHLNDIMITLGKQTFFGSQTDLFFCPSVLVCLMQIVPIIIKQQV